MQSSPELEAFLRDVAPRAFRIARLALRDDQDALDAMQEAMIKLARRYVARPPAEWPPLFYAILRNCVHDLQRVRQGRNRVLWWFGTLYAARTNETEPPATLTDTPGPHEVAVAEDSIDRLQRAIAGLPPRQREAFLLRTVEDLDVRETALAMQCSESSVKTHYSRAVQALRAILGEET